MSQKDQVLVPVDPVAPLVDLEYSVGRYTVLTDFWASIVTLPSGVVLATLCQSLPGQSVVEITDDRAYAAGRALDLLTTALARLTGPHRPAFAATIDPTVRFSITPARQRHVERLLHRLVDIQGDRASRCR